MLAAPTIPQVFVFTTDRLLIGCVAAFCGGDQTTCNFFVGDVSLDSWMTQGQTVTASDFGTKITMIADDAKLS